MADTTGKCTNFASCTLAYRNQPIPYTGNPVCPECGQPLTTKTAASGPSPLLLIAGGAGAVILLAGGLFFAFSHHKSPPSQPTASAHSEEAPASPSTPAPEPEPANPPPSIAAATPSPAVSDSPAPSAPSTPDAPSASTTPPPAPVTPDQPAPPVSSSPETPPATPAPPQTIASLMPNPAPSERDSAEPVSVEKMIDTNIKGDENQRVRAEVLKRIDMMPNLSAGDRQKLYASVDRAKGMGRVITIPFAMGSRTVGSKGVEQLKTALQSPQVVNLVKNPMVVFVLLGYADKRGDEKANQKISVDRAEDISQTLKEKCGMLNVTQPVGMGGSALFDSGNLSKNRVVEVWAVVP